MESSGVVVVIKMLSRWFCEISSSRFVMFSRVYSGCWMLSTG